MRVSKIAFAVALSAGLLSGCNYGPYDDDDNDNDNGGGGEVTSPLKGGYWEINPVGTPDLLSGAELPKIYVFDGKTQKFYNDSANFGTYTITSSDDVVEDIEEGTITFRYYPDPENMDDFELVTGSYSVEDGVLTITGTDSNYGDLSADDHSEDETVKDAVAAANDASGYNGYVQILNTTPKNDDDPKGATGRLRVKLSEATDFAVIESGKITLDLVYQVDENTEQPDDTGGNWGYVSLFTESASNSYLNGELVLDEGAIRYRDGDGNVQPSQGDFELGETLQLEMSWEIDTFSFSINGVQYADALPVKDPETGVTTIDIKLGDNSNSTHYELLGDNLKIYAKNELDEYEVVFEDDFESYSADYDLASAPHYNSNTNQALVKVEGDAGGEPGDVTDDFESYQVGMQIDVANSAYTVSPGVDGDLVKANISDDVAKSGSQSLYISDNSTDTKGVVSRAFINGAAESGTVTTSVYIPAEGYKKSTYLYLGNSTGADSKQTFTEVAFGSSDVRFRDENGDLGALQRYAKDTWVDVSISWEAAGDGTYDVTVTVDGAEYANLKAQNTTGAPTLFALYNGDNSSVGTYSYFDDIDSELF